MGPGRLSRTSGEAYDTPNGPMVRIQGRAGGFLLTHVSPLGCEPSPDEWTRENLIKDLYDKIYGLHREQQDIDRKIDLLKKEIEVAERMSLVITYSLERVTASDPIPGTSYSMVRATEKIGEVNLPNTWTDPGLALAAVGVTEGKVAETDSGNVSILTGDAEYVLMPINRNDLARRGPVKVEGSF